MTNVDSIFKSRDYFTNTKVHLVKAMVFPIVMYGCESWTIKKAECRRIAALDLWCWRRLLRVPWAARSPTSPSYRKSALNIHWKDWCWNWNSNTLATWWEKLSHWKRPWCWERLRAGGEGDWVWLDSRSWWWTVRPGVLRFMGLQRVGHDWATELTTDVKTHSAAYWFFSTKPTIYTWNMFQN